MQKIKEFYKFGDFCVNLSERVLTRNGKFIPVTPKVLETLLVLLEDAGTLVEKDELMKRIWDDRFVEEGNLTFNIGMLRKALGDNAARPRFIETVPRRGYRFIGEVTKISEISETPLYKTELVTHLPLEEVFNEETTAEIRDDISVVEDFSKGSFSSLYFGIAAICILLLTGAAFYTYKSRLNVNPSDSIKKSNLKMLRVTNSGKVTNFAVAPNGQYLVYSQKDDEGESLWLRQISTGSQTRILAPENLNFSGIAVTPDSQFVYYSVFADNAVNTVLWRIPLLGGVPQAVPNVDSDVSVSFSPDGKQFVYTESKMKEKKTFLKISDADGAHQKTLITTIGNDRAFPKFRAKPAAWSPDGKTIACAVTVSENGKEFSRILLVNPEDGSEKYLSDYDWHEIEFVDWTSPDKIFLISREENSKSHQIWEASTTDGTNRQITSDLNNYQWLGSVNGKIYSLQENSYSAIYVADFSENQKTFKPRRIVSESDSVSQLVWANDGKIYHNSRVSGQNEIWRINANGTSPEQITRNSEIASNFDVSPVTNQIIYYRWSSDGNRLRITDSKGNLIRESPAGQDNFSPLFSPDGKSYIFQRGGHNTAQILQRGFLDDKNSFVDITNFNAVQPVFSPDGQYLAYHFLDYEDAKPTWKIGILNGETGEFMRKINLPFPISNRQTAVHPKDNKLTMVFNKDGVAALLMISPDGTNVETFENLSKNKIAAFAWSPDGNQLVFSDVTDITDIVSLDQ